MQYKHERLTNGLTLITSPLQETKAVTVLVLVPTGSRYETKKNNGVSHFVEHLVFKGTKKRPTSLDITKELDAVGADFNAFTSKDHTGYYIKVAADKAVLAFDILSDMLFNSTFEKAEIDKERGVIVEEINMYEDNPLMSIGDVFESAVFGDVPLGWNIAGPRSVIKSISRADLVKYHKTHYTPQSMVVSVAGAITPARARSLAKKFFGIQPRAGKKQHSDSVTLNQKSPRVVIKHRATEQVQLCLGFPSYGLGHKNLYALYLLATIMGGTMSSRLFVTVREQHGLAYFVRASAHAYQDVGTFAIQSGLDKRRIKQAISLIVSELKKVAEEGVSEQELNDAKEYIKGKLILSLEDSETIADWFGKQELLYKKTYTPEERMRQIDAVTLADVARAAEDIIDMKKSSLALIGPFKNKAEFKALLK